MKELWRKIRVKVLAVAGFLVLKLLYSTIRWEEPKVARPDLVWQDGKAQIFVFWHGRIIMMPALFKKLMKSKETRPLCTLISRHSDGRIIAKVIGYMGHTSIAGSSSRGGATAVRSLVQRVGEGYDLAITPDGPRGPAQKLKRGAIDIASKVDAAVYPVAFSAERCWRMRSWDRMLVPRPFSRVIGIVGEPIYLPPDSGSYKDGMELLQKRLDEVTEEADSYEFS